jgi:spore coat protein JB
MTIANNNKAKLYHDIDMFSFFITDMLEYLDTHPYDSKAIEHLKHYVRLKNAAMAEYAKLYGPLTVSSVEQIDSNEWKWATQPMPWVNQNIPRERRD